MSTLEAIYSTPIYKKRTKFVKKVYFRKLQKQQRL
ncbi:hypothetical protein T09_15773 [Trichinella sp. T9]|nr:hypothetical protein T09_15773 [Trichinella sp. T9]